MMKEFGFIYLFIYLKIKLQGAQFVQFLNVGRALLSKTELM
jgi:hypothetical protein